MLSLYTRWAQRRDQDRDARPATRRRGRHQERHISIEGDWAYAGCAPRRAFTAWSASPPFDSQRAAHVLRKRVVYPDIDETIRSRSTTRTCASTSCGRAARRQHVNKTESASASRPAHRIALHSDAERSQHKNRSTAMRILRSKLFESNRRRRGEDGQHSRQKKKIEWGSQIRSYGWRPIVGLHHRTEIKVINVDAVLDGDLAAFMIAHLLQLRAIRPRSGRARRGVVKPQGEDEGM